MIILFWGPRKNTPLVEPVGSSGKIVLTVIALGLILRTGVRQRSVAKSWWLIGMQKKSGSISQMNLNPLNVWTVAWRMLQGTFTLLGCSTSFCLLDALIMRILCPQTNWRMHIFQKVIMTTLAYVALNSTDLFRFNIHVETLEIKRLLCRRWVESPFNVFKTLYCCHQLHLYDKSWSMWRKQRTSLLFHSNQSTSKRCLSQVWCFF